MKDNISKTDWVIIQNPRVVIKQICRQICVKTTSGGENANQSNYMGN